MHDANSNQLPAPTPAANPLPSRAPRPRPARRETWRSTLSTVAILLLAPAIAFFLTIFVFQPYEVDGESMETTLAHNDRLLVWKLPRTWSKITGHAYIPQRGDVVVFTEPSIMHYGQDPSKQLIKRVVGLPGDRVVVNDGVLKVYNTEHPEGFEPDGTLAYGSVIKDTPIEGDWHVGDSQIFVVGDNRGNSLDSRTFGPIDASNVVGKLVARMLPIGDIKAF